MDRRQFLAAVGAAGTAPVAGCAGVGKPEPLPVTSDETDDDGTERHLTFVDDGARQATFAVLQRREQSSGTGRFPLHFSVWHRDGLGIDSISLRLRAPPTSVSPPAEVYLKTPDGGPWPPIDLNTDDDLWTVIGIDDIGELGEGSLGLDTVLVPRGVPAPTVGIHFGVGLSEGGLAGGAYWIQDYVAFDVVRSP